MGTAPAPGNDIRGRTLKTLEWSRLKDFLSAEASTAWGGELCQALMPAGDLIAAQRLMDETGECWSLIQGGAELDVSGLPDIRIALNRLGLGAHLSARELFEIRDCLLLSRTVKNSLSLLDGSSIPCLKSMLPGLFFDGELVGRIENAIDQSLEIKDQASHKLSGLRRELGRLEREIKGELHRIIHGSPLAKCLQEPIYTHRNGRYVLAVNASMAHMIQGIVHDSSASGLTVYVEPMAVIEPANRLRLIEAECEREIARILSELSELVKTAAPQIAVCFRCLVELDFIAARARLAVRYNGTAPELVPEGPFRLLSARHPLLVLQNSSGGVVANDILLGGEARTLVITGPNTGGKTVLLKTVGLLSLMAKAGLLLPVLPGSTALIFDEVEADIGDEQSLSQNLSTFSSHITNIIDIVNHASAGRLFLLDEVGAGTDPREGAALARAVLEHLSRSGAFTVTTTHFGELKALAYTEPGFINGSLEFDEETLSPTYQLRLGVPGSSKATTIARRLGLSDEIVRRSEAYLRSSAADVQQTIEQLDKRLQHLCELEESAEAKVAAARELENAALFARQRLESEERLLRDDLQQRLEGEFVKVRELLRQLVVRLQQEPSLQRAQLAKAEMERLRQDLRWLGPVKPPGLQALAVGQRVLVAPLNQNAVIQSLPVSRQPEALALVKAGALKLKVPLKDLQPVSPEVNAGKAKRSVHGANAVSLAPIAPQSGDFFLRTSRNTLDLRGERVATALADLEQFLDSAKLYGVSPVMIIHGHGTGAVKSAVRDCLQTSPYARSFRPGAQSQGGDGVTIVDL